MIPDPFPLSFRPGPPGATRPRRAAAYGLARNEERYTVPGGGAALIELREGDNVTVTDKEGGQPCELLAAREDGSPDPALLGVRADAPGDGLRSTLAAAAPGMERLRRGLAARGIDPAGTRAIGLFSTAGAPATAQALSPAEAAGCSWPRPPRHRISRNRPPRRRLP